MRLSQRATELAESATLAVAGMAARMKAQGIDVISFGAGEPDFDTPDYIRKAGIEAIQSGQTRYPKPAHGLPAVREAVCAKLKRYNALHYTPDQVIVTSGGKDAAYLAIHAVVDPGDEVVIPAPYWVSYPEMVRLAGGVPVYVTGPEKNDYKLTPQAIESVLSNRTRMFILNSPSNPSGVTYHPDETREIAAVLSKRDLLVLSDEIYDQLLFDGQKALSYAAVSDAAYRQTVTVNSASKTYAMTGWRLGYAAGPVDVIQAMAKLQSQSTSGAATFGQIALAAALNHDHADIDAMRAEFERRGRHMWQRLTSIPGVRCSRPTGAFYCFPHVGALYPRVGVSGSGPFAEKMLKEARVAVVPGLPFGMDDHVRLSFATSMKQIDEGLNRIEEWLK
jgi:aspartate aminotransferase